MVKSKGSLHKSQNLMTLNFWKNKIGGAAGKKGGEANPDEYSVCTVNIKGATNLLVTDRETSSSDPMCMVWLGQYSADDVKR